jgi:hypothetical protein
MPNELRCDSNKLHGGILEGKIFEVACRSRWCGWRSGAIILHHFSIETGELIETLQFKQPSK